MSTPTIYHARWKVNSGRKRFSTNQPRDGKKILKLRTGLRFIFAPRIQERGEGDLGVQLFDENAN